MRRAGMWLLVLALLASGPALACRLVTEGVATPAPSPTPFPEETATAAATAEPTAVGMVAFDSEELGLSFEYPADWFLDAGDDIPMVASDVRLLGDEDSGVGGAVVLFLVDDATRFGEGSLDDIVEGIVADLVTGGEVVDGPRGFTMAGQEAATATVETVEESGAVAVSIVTAIRHEGRAALVSAAVPRVEAEQYREALDAVTGSVRLRAPAEPDVEGSVRYGETVRGEVTGLRGSAWRFEGMAGDVVQIEVTPATDELDVTVDVRDGDGQSILPGGVVDDAFGTETIRNLALPADGDYLIIMRGFAGSTGRYTLSLAAQDGEVGSGEGELELGGSYRGRLEPNGVDSYVLPDLGVPVTLEVIPEAELDAVLEVYDSGGGLIASADVGFSGGAERVTAPAGGGTVQVRGFAGASGEYTLRVSEGEEDGIRVVVTGELQEGESGGHAFPFTAPEGARVTAEVAPAEGLDVLVEIWNDDEETLLDTIDLSFGVEDVSFIAPVAGNYSFVVRAYEAAGGAYTATLAGPVPVVFELAAGDEVAGIFDASATVEFLVALSAGETIVVTATPDSTTDAVLEVTDLDGNLLASADDYFPGGAETLTFTAPGDLAESTLFFIQVRDYNGAAGGRFTLVIEGG